MGTTKIETAFSTPHPTEEIEHFGSSASAATNITYINRQSGLRRPIRRLAFLLAEYFKNPRPYLMLLGFAIILCFWYLSVDVLKLPRFRNMPGFIEVIQEWTRRNPSFGISIFTLDYYRDIWVSCRRVIIAFLIATCFGVPVGLFLGWSRKFRAYVFPV
ncbi:MAG: ABC transporter permease subunit, partial [Candidatus Saccharimonadales bacterium]